VSDEEEPYENWFRPDYSVKAACMAAISDMYDGKDVEIWFDRSKNFYGGGFSNISWGNWLQCLERNKRLIRPIHKRRALIDLYWTKPYSKWEVQSIFVDTWISIEEKNGRYRSVLTQEPEWGYKNCKFRPSPDFEPELYKKYLEIMKNV